MSNKMFSVNEHSLPFIGTSVKNAEHEAREKATDRTGGHRDEVALGASVCGHLITLLFAAVLFHQFEIAFAVHDDFTAGPQWCTVCFVIGIFTIASFLYNNTLRDERITSTVANLIPEMVTIIVVYLIFARRLSDAFLVLVCGTLFMSLTVVACSMHFLLFRAEVDKTTSTEPVEILIV